jgi:hypothetical protein
MAHDWIFGVLSDLADYARKHGLSLTAEGSEALLRKAREEIAERPAPRDIPAPPPGNRPH